MYKVIFTFTVLGSLLAGCVGATEYAHSGHEASAQPVVDTSARHYLIGLGIQAHMHDLWPHEGFDTVDLSTVAYHVVPKADLPCGLAIAVGCYLPRARAIYVAAERADQTGLIAHEYAHALLWGVGLGDPRAHHAHPVFEGSEPGSYDARLEAGIKAEAPDSPLRTWYAWHVCEEWPNWTAVAWHDSQARAERYECADANSKLAPYTAGL